MGTLVTVEGDPVTGTDTHAVTGTFPNGNPYSGTGDFTYAGSITGGLCDFVRVGGKPLALVTSTSTLDPGEAGTRHNALNGSNYNPSTIPPALLFAPPIVGDGAPSAGVGSSFVAAGGVKVLLDGDDIDTCNIPGGKASSTVAAQGQDFVSCSE
jgi:hypothetical protein